MSVPCGIILLNLTKGKTVGNLIEALCAVCNATSNSYSVKPNELCDEHYFEWAEEKAFADLNADEEYFHLV